MANLKSLLADTTTDFTPNVPNYKIAGMEQSGASGSSLTISKSDGSTFIVVWNEPPIWDKDKNETIVPPDDKVTIDFGGSYTYTIYDPLVGTNPLASDRATSVVVNLKGSPLLIKVTP